jgi:Ni/Co efflux regulator RcnB
MPFTIPQEEISMKKLFAGAVALGLFAAVPAFAADDKHDDKNTTHQDSGHPAADAGHQSGGAASGRQSHGNAMGGAASGGQTHTSNTMGASGGQSHGNAGAGHTGTTGNAMYGAGLGRSSPMSGGTGHDNAMSTHTQGSHQNAMSGGNNASNQATRRSHTDFNRRVLTAQHQYHYRGGAYRGPSGYSYRRWAFGQILPSLYYSRNYWISDYSDYGLQDPPYGCEWVRYGDDALLIDQDTGEILEVVYDQFD